MNTTEKLRATGITVEILSPEEKRKMFRDFRYSVKRGKQIFKVYRRRGSSKRFKKVLLKQKL